MGRAPTRGLSLYPFDNTALRIKAQPIFGKNMDSRITIDPKVYHGQACIKGTRIPVHQILRMLANGDTVEDLLREYSSVTGEDIRACLDYAASLAETAPQDPKKRSILELRGLGKEIWQGVDAQKYVDSLREEMEQNNKIRVVRAVQQHNDEHHRTLSRPARPINVAPIPSPPPMPSPSQDPQHGSKPSGGENGSNESTEKGNERR